MLPEGNKPLVPFLREQIDPNSEGRHRKKRIGVIDLGSHSVTLYVFETRKDNPPKCVFKTSAICNLAQGTGLNGCNGLNPYNAAQALRTLGIYNNLIRNGIEVRNERVAIDHAVIIATAASRHHAAAHGLNAHFFADAREELCGRPIGVVTTRAEEALMGAGLLTGDAHYLDTIAALGSGGGSTEFVRMRKEGDAFELVHSFTDDGVGTASLNTEILDKGNNQALRHLREIIRRHPSGGDKLLGWAGKSFHAVGIVLASRIPPTSLAVGLGIPWNKETIRHLEAMRDLRPKDLNAFGDEVTGRADVFAAAVELHLAYGMHLSPQHIFYPKGNIRRGALLLAGLW